ncbi:MAG: class I SAM-dependent methyltransferase [Candidatus Binatia bacterium]
MRQDASMAPMNGFGQEYPGGGKARSLLGTVLDRYGPRDFAVQLWDGEQWPAQADVRPRFKLILRSPGVVRGLFSRPDSLSFGEAFVFNHLDIKGSLLDIFAPADRLMTIPWSFAEKCRLLTQLWSIPAPTYARTGLFAGFGNAGAQGSLGRTRAAVNYHYDHPVEFWRLWLDESLSYSCAYFQSPDDSLAVAQKAKLDYICRKLRLRPGMRLLDMGCGWGALIVHAATHYGVEAVGLTVSPEQAEVARQRIHQAGVERQCRIEVENFFAWREPEGFDRVSSIGAAEHVPEIRFEEYFKLAVASLRPGGQFLHHAITRTPSALDRPGRSYSHRYVFPDYFLATIGQTTRAAEAAGFEIRDVESLREHYALTLRHWLQRFEAAQDALQKQTDELSCRVFRLYLAGSAYEFQSGRMNLHHSLLVKPDRGRSGVPLTRQDWYRTDDSLAGALSHSHYGKEAVNGTAKLAD